MTRRSVEMALYLIAFNDEWVPELTLEQLREAGRAGRSVCDEMTAAGVFVFSDWRSVLTWVSTWLKPAMVTGRCASAMPSTHALACGYFCA